jgi:hypothetical protein
VVITAHHIGSYVPQQKDVPTEETSPMRQVQQRRQTRQTHQQELDLCTPSGRRLPF